MLGPEQSYRLLLAGLPAGEECFCLLDVIRKRRVVTQMR